MKSKSKRGSSFKQVAPGVWRGRGGWMRVALSPDVHARLREFARKQGLRPSEVMGAAIRESF